MILCPIVLISYFHPITRCFFYKTPNKLDLFEYDGRLIRSLKNPAESSYFEWLYFFPKEGKFILSTIERHNSKKMKFTIYNANGDKVCDFSNAMSYYNEFHFIPERNKILSYETSQGHIAIWNDCTCELLSTLEYNSVTSKIGISKKEERIIAYSNQEDLKIWDFDGNRVDSFVVRLGSTKFTIPPDESYFMYTTDNTYFFDKDGKLMSQIDIRSPKIIKQGSGLINQVVTGKKERMEKQFKMWDFLPVPYGRINYHLVSNDWQRKWFSDKNLIVYKNSDRQGKNIKMWDTEGNLIKKMLFDKEEFLFMEEGCPVVVIWDTNRSKGKIWNAKTDTLVDLGSGQEPGIVSFDMENERVIAHFPIDIIKVWDFHGNLIFQTDTSSSKKIMISNDNQLSAMTTILPWSAKYIPKMVIQRWKEAYYLNLDNDVYKKLEAHEKWIMTAAFNASGSLITGDWDGKIVIWNDRGEKIKEIAAFDWRVEHVNISDDNTKVLALSGLQVKVWELDKNGLKIVDSHNFSIKEKNINSISFISGINGDKILVVSNNGDNVRIFDFDGKLLDSLSEKLNSQIYNNPEKNRRILYDYKDKEIKIYTQDYQLIKKLKNQKRPIESQNDQYFISQSELSSDVFIFDTNGNQKVKIPFSEFLRGASFLPSGDIVMTVESKTAKLWDLEGNLLGTLTGHSNFIEAFGFIDSGRFIFTTSSRGNIIV